jgi:hypothetical protein
MESRAQENPRENRHCKDTSDEVDESTIPESLKNQKAKLKPSKV